MAKRNTQAYLNVASTSDDFTYGSKRANFVKNDLFTNQYVKHCPIQ